LVTAVIIVHLGNNKPSPLKKAQFKKNVMGKEKEMLKEVFENTRAIMKHLKMAVTKKEAPKNILKKVSAKTEKK